MSETAKVVGRSQPAISLQIKDLEEIVGFRVIFHRRGMIVFTEQGEALVNLARQTETHLSDRIEAIRGAPETSLRFAVTHDIHDACRDQVEIFAEYGISLEAMTSNEILSSLAEGVLDAGIAKSSVPHGNAAASWTCALNWAGDPVAASQAGPMKLVLLDVGCFYHHLALTLFSDLGFDDVELVICDNWADVARYLVDGGVTIVSSGWGDALGGVPCSASLPDLPHAVLNLLHRPLNEEPAMEWGIAKLNTIATASLSGRAERPGDLWSGEHLKALVPQPAAFTMH